MQIIGSFQELQTVLYCWKFGEWCCESEYYIQKGYRKYSQFLYHLFATRVDWLTRGMKKLEHMVLEKLKVSWSLSFLERYILKSLIQKKMFIIFT